MKKDKTCPKCGGEMERGKFFPLNLKTPITFGKLPEEKKGILTYSPKEKKEIAAYGCQRCGYIECYMEEFD